MSGQQFQKETTAKRQKMKNGIWTMAGDRKRGTENAEDYNGNVWKQDKELSLQSSCQSFPVKWCLPPRDIWHCLKAVFISHDWEGTMDIL